DRRLIVMVWTDLVPRDDLDEFVLGDLEELQKQVEARGRSAVVLLRQLPAASPLLAVVPDVDVDEMIRASETALDELCVVANALEHALDLLVVVLLRNALDA